MNPSTPSLIPTSMVRARAVTRLVNCLMMSLLLIVPACGRNETTAYRQSTGNTQESSKPMNTLTATFAAGCFWGVQHIFQEVPGVIDTSVGYLGGHTQSPTYRDVCTDSTGHAEAVEVKYDPSKVSYEQLLAVFWHAHDPTTLNRQGPDEGTQYRSAIFFHSPAQEAAAKASMAKENKSGRFSGPIVTQIVPAASYWKAEEYHQFYIDKNPQRACHLLDEPLEKILASAPAPGSADAKADTADLAAMSATCSPDKGCSAELFASKTDAQWKKILTPEQYQIMRNAGTERAFTGKYWNTHTPGTYTCAACGQPLFPSDAKFESGTGWPSFFKPVSNKAVIEKTDDTHGMVRTEILCAQCKSHLGHVFDDGPAPTGLRYCLNSAVLNLIPATQPAETK